MARRGPAMAMVMLLVLLAVPDRAFPRGGAGGGGKGDYVSLVTVTAQAGYAVPNTDEYLNAFCYQLAAGYSPIPWLEVALEAGRFTSSVSLPEPHGVPVHTIASGELDVTGVTLTAQLRYPVPEIFSAFYGLAGAGYYLVDYSMAGGASRFLQESYEKDANPEKRSLGQSVDNALGFHLGAGVEYHLTDHLSLVGEGRYVILAPAFEGRSYDESGKAYSFSGELDLNTWLFTGGIKVLF